MATILHGTAVAIDGHAVLLRGQSGSGKSDLALRLIDRGAKQISDDGVRIETADSIPLLWSVPNIAGKIEVRGVGICTVDFVHSAPMRLVVEFARDIERMPPDDVCTSVGDFSVPLVMLDPFQHSSALKVELALRSVIDAGLLPMAKHSIDANESTGF